MSRLMALAAAALMIAALQVEWSAPATAQASCMHCNFAFGKCNRSNPNAPDKCKAERSACVKKCKMVDTGQSGAADKAKGVDQKKK